MTTRKINDTIIQELKARVKKLELQLQLDRNNPTVAVPIRTSDNLPEEAAQGEIVLGDDGLAYKHQDEEWTPLIGETPTVDTVFFSISGVLVVNNGVLRWYPLVAGTITTIHCAVGTAPTGSDVTVRVKCNGSSIGTATVTAGAHEASFVPASPAFSIGDFFTVDITAIGSTTPGTGLVVQIKVA